MIVRYSIAIVLGCLVTLCVLFGMQALIATAKSHLDDSETRRFVNFVRVERDETMQRKERKMNKPAQPEAPPPETAQPRIDSIDPTPVAIAAPMAQMDLEMSVEGLGLVASDGDYLPIVKIPPAYPMSAQNNGVEGYCIVEYTVTRAGSVKDAVVIEADPKRVFDRVSIAAALKFKYRPRVVNGEPIEVHGVRNRFVYKLES